MEQQERSAETKPIEGRAGGLPRAVKRLGWVSYFTDVASEMAYPVVPLFLSSALGAPAVALGFIEGAAECLVSLMKGWSGWHCDRTGRRVPYVRLGYGLGAVAKPLLALAFAWPMVFLARAVDRLGKGLRTTARDAMIADAVDARLAARAFGFHRMMDTAGALTGVLVSLLLLWLLPGHYRTIFLVAALPGAVAIRLTFKLKEQPRPSAAACAPTEDQAVRRAPWRGLPAPYWRAFALLVFFSLANSSDAFLILRAKGLGLGDTQTIFAYVLFNLTYALGAYPAGALADAVGKWPLIIGGWLLYGVIYFTFAGAAALDVWWLFPLYGLYMALTEGVGKALIAVRTPAERKGAAIGLFQMAMGLGALAASIAAGWLWDAVGPQAAFRLGGTIALVASAAAVAVAAYEKRGAAR